jgi:hypothetical protein
MIRHIKIKRCNIALVLRHRFEKQKRFDRTFTRWEIGFWFRKNKIVGINNFSKPSEWNSNLVNSYMIGVELLLFRSWITIDFNGMHLDIDD